MKRQIIVIDEESCNGCGLCVSACHEGAIGLVDGKAKLLRDDYCDGLGNCLPVCPTGAITFEEREALPFDAAAVAEKTAVGKVAEPLPCGCPGTHAKSLKESDGQKLEPCPIPTPSESRAATPSASELMQWPVQLKLVPVRAPYFDGAELLIAADCAAYAHGAFHDTYMKNRVTVIGCPKLDTGDYTEKLTEIFSYNNIRSVTIIRMEVPCCQGIAAAAVTALNNCGKKIPRQVITLSVRGEELE